MRYVYIGRPEWVSACNNSDRCARNGCPGKIKGKCYFYGDAGSNSQYLGKDEAMLGYFVQLNEGYNE